MDRARQHDRCLVVGSRLAPERSLGRDRRLVAAAGVCSRPHADHRLPACARCSPAWLPAPTPAAAACTCACGWPSVCRGGRCRQARRCAADAAVRPAARRTRRARRRPARGAAGHGPPGPRRRLLRRAGGGPVRPLARRRPAAGGSGPRSDRMHASARGARSAPEPSSAPVPRSRRAPRSSARCPAGEYWSGAPARRRKHGARPVGGAAGQPARLGRGVRARRRGDRVVAGPCPGRRPRRRARRRCARPVRCARRLCEPWSGCRSARSSASWC